MQSHKIDRSAHKMGKSKFDTIHRILSLCSACLWFPDSSIVLPLFLVYDPEGSRTMRVFPSFFARISTGMCFLAECMHHRISCKQICRNINRFRFTFEYLFTNSFIYFFQSSFFHRNFRIHALFFQIRKMRKCHVTDLCIGHIRNLPEHMLCFFSLTNFLSPVPLRHPTDTRSPAFAHILPD